MIAENSVMPYMPRLEMENVPPVNSCGFSLPAFACTSGEKIRAHPVRQRSELDGLRSSAQEEKHLSQDTRHGAAHAAKLVVASLGGFCSGLP